MKLFIILSLAISFSISSAGAQTEINVQTDYEVFKQGQTVTITGNSEGGVVAIQVIEPTGISILVRTIETNSSGNFDLEFRIPQTATLGVYQLIVSTAIDDTPMISTTTFEVVEKGETIEQQERVTQEKREGGCLIATATFGSEMAPQVQFLREIRDNTVLQTESGTSFMTGFNHFYYSFSPAVADYERENPVFKESVKLAITPLLASLTLLQYADIDSEPEMLGYGISIILLNIGIYFIIPSVVIIKIKKLM